MKTLIVSSSQNPTGRSSYLAREAADWLRRHNVDAAHIALVTGELPGFDNGGLFESATYLEYCKLTREADSLIFASPVYNWGICADLKRFIEVVGCTNEARHTPFFDKLVSFIFAAGLPHSYMVMSSVATSMMMDFRCIINPYQAYLHNRHWTDDTCLTDDGRQKLNRMLEVQTDLAMRLQGYSQTSSWTV